MGYLSSAQSPTTPNTHHPKNLHKNHTKPVFVVSDGVCEGGDCMNGSGRMGWSNGAIIYSGKAEGRGSYFEKRGIQYSGPFKGGKFHGKGNLKLPTGYKYSGDFENGLKNGIGQATYINGDIYLGEWKDDLEHGSGTVILGKGKKYTCEFQNGEAIGSAKFTTPKYTY